ncbi:MAG: hypothetical protein PHY15_06525 [Eubacteriales bacterium]|nr:hypothetical protein [Eubacteriales bacterium]
MEIKLNKFNCYFGYYFEEYLVEFEIQKPFTKEADALAYCRSANFKVCLFPNFLLAMQAAEFHFIKSNQKGKYKTASDGEDLNISLAELYKELSANYKPEAGISLSDKEQFRGFAFASGYFRVEKEDPNNYESESVYN